MFTIYSTQEKYRDLALLEAGNTALKILHRAAPDKATPLGELIAGLEASVYDLSPYHRVETDEGRVLGLAKEPINRTTLERRLNHLEDLVRVSPTNDYDLESIKLHLTSLKNVFNTAMGDTKLLMRAPESAFVNNHSAIREAIDQLYQLVYDFINLPVPPTRNSVVIAVGHWNLHINNSDATLQRVNDEPLVSKTVDLDTIFSVLDSAVYVVEQCFDPQLLTVFKGLADELTAEGVIPSKRDKIKRLMTVIERQIPDMCYDLLNKKLPIIHQYLRSYTQKIDLSPLYYTRKTRLPEETRVAKLLTLKLAPMPELRQRVDALEEALYTGKPLDGLYNQVLEDYPFALTVSCEEQDDLSTFERMSETVKDMKTLSNVNVWKQLGDYLQDLGNNEVALEHIPQLHSHYSQNVNSMKVLCGGSDDTLKGFTALHQSVVAGIDLLYQGLEAFVEGEDSAFDGFSEAVAIPETQVLPYGLCLKDSMYELADPSTLSHLSVEDATYQQTCKLIERLYETDVQSYRAKLAEVHRTFSQTEGNFALEQYHVINLFLCETVPLFEEALEDLCYAFLAPH